MFSIDGRINYIVDILPFPLSSDTLTPKDRFLSTLRGTMPDRLPIWFPGHCGFWDAHFRASITSTLQDTLSHNETICSMAADSSRRWQLDATTVPTHLLAAAELLGQHAAYADDGSHQLQGHLHSPQQIRALHVRYADPDGDATRRVKIIADTAGDRAVIVPHAGPFTLSAHLIEGNADWHPRYRALLFQYPTEARTLLTQAAGAITAYGRHIQLAGADALYLDETWSHLVGPEDLAVFILPYIERIVKSLAPFPVVVRAPGMDSFVEQLRKSGLAAWHPGLHSDPGDLRNKTLHSLAFLGSFDPGRLLSPLPVVTHAAGRQIEAFGERDFVVSLASDPLPHTDPRHLHAFVEAIQQYPLKVY